MSGLDWESNPYIKIQAIVEVYRTVLIQFLIPVPFGHFLRTLITIMNVINQQMLPQ